MIRTPEQFALDGRPGRSTAFSTGPAAPAINTQKNLLVVGDAVLISAYRQAQLQELGRFRPRKAATPD